MTSPIAFATHTAICLGYVSPVCMELILMLELHCTFTAKASPHLQNNVLLYSAPFSVFSVSVENSLV